MTQKTDPKKAPSAYRHRNGRYAQFWPKDGAWHVTEPYQPTESDRKRYPASYPEGDDGPFYRWAERSFHRRQDAIDALEAE